MANILKLQDQLKGLPDTALVQYAQNPDGNVPQYLILGELQRRKTMRDEYQQSQAQAPQKTVAEDLAGGVAQLQPAMQQPQPQQPVGQGVASLPVPDNMFQEQNMAGGGIVAFEDGGEVERFQTGNLVSARNNALREIDAQMASLTSQIRKLGGLFGLAQQSPEERAEYESLNRQLDALKAQRFEVMQAVKPEESSSPLGRAIFGAPEKSIDFQTEGSMVSNLPSAYTGAPQQEKTPAAPVPGTMPVPTVGRAPSLPEPIEFKPTPLETESVRQRMLQAQDQYGEEAIRTRQKQLREEAGIKDIYADQLSELQKEREGLRSRKDEAIGQAFLEAGLGMMAGTSPFALTNIGTGALRGVASLREAQKEIRQNERELRKETNSINREQQGVLEARLRGDQEAVERGQARIDSAVDKYDRKADANAMLQNQALQFNIGKKFDRDLAQFSSSSADFRLDKQLAADAAKHNNMMRMYEERIKASDRATAAKLLQNRVYALREMNKDPDYQMFLESLTSKYEKKGGASNPQYQFEKQMYTNRYLSDALGLSGGLDSGVSSADSLLAD
jgi:hypothetical protein